MEMISEAIVGALRTHKRVVIPGLGAFLRKEGQAKVIFVEFLKKDDGVLSGLLFEQYGLSAREAQEAVGGFVGDLQRMVTTPGGFVIEGLGVMRIDANGVLDLEYDPKAKIAVSQPVEPVFEAPRVEEFEIVVAREEAPKQVVFEMEESAADEAEEAGPAVIEFEPSQPVVEQAPRRVVEPEPADDQEFDDMDMVYHKPPKRIVERRKKQADLIMIIAIAAAALAILAMIYGHFTERRSRMPEAFEAEQVGDSVRVDE